MADSVFDFVPETEKGLNAFLDKIEAEGSAALTDISPDWDRAIRFYRTGTPDPTPKKDWTQFRANLVRPTARRKGALLTENKPKIDVLPLTDGFTATAEVLKRTIDAGWEEHGMQAACDDIGQILQVINAGGIEVGWDRHANFGMGNIAINTIDPRQILFDPAVVRAREVGTRAQYMRVRSIVPLPTAAELFPGIADQLKPSTKLLATEPDANPKGGLAGALARATARWNSKIRTEPPIGRVQLDSYWFCDPRRDEDGNPLYPGGRCVVRANDEIICLRDGFSEKALREETQNPYYDGRWPIEWIDNIPDIDSAWGQDEILAARFIQNTFNRLGNSTVQTMLDNARPFIHAPKNSLSDDTLNKLRALNHIVVEYTAGRGEVHRAPSPIPSGVYLQFMSLCQSLLEYTEGLQDAGGGIPAKGRAEVRSAAMLEGLQSAAQVLVRAQARRFEDLLERVGQLWISRIFQFMSVDRLMWIVGPMQTEKFAFQRAQLTNEVLEAALKQAQANAIRKQQEEMNEIPDGEIITVQPSMPENLTGDQQYEAIRGAWQQFRFSVRPFSSLSSTMVQRAALMESLHQRTLVPGKDVLEEYGINNPQDKLNEAVAEKQARQALGITDAPPPQQKGGKKK